MASKLAIIFLAVFAVAMVTAKPGQGSEAYRRFKSILDRRGCIGPCEKDCGGSDSNCCMYKDTGRRGRCRSVKTWPYYEYMCINPYYQYVTATEVIHDDCGLKGK